VGILSVLMYMYISVIFVRRVALDYHYGPRLAGATHEVGSILKQLQTVNNIMV